MKIPTAAIHVPTREEVESLKIGDLALSPWGKYSPIVSIHAKRDDINGRLFACFYVDNGPESSISQSYKEGELVRTLPICNELTSTQCDDLERYINSKR